MPTCCRCCLATAASSSPSGTTSRDSGASRGCTSSSRRRTAIRSRSTDEDISTWVDRLRAAPEIGRVDPGVVDRTRDFAWLADRQLLALHGRALDEALERLRPRGMMDAVAARRELLTVPSPDVAALIRQDPAGLFDLLRDSLSGAQAGFGVGVSGGGYVTPDGHSRLIIARPKRPPYDAEFSRALDARLREIEASIGRAAARDLNPPESTTLPTTRSRGRRSPSSSPAAIASRSRPKRSSRRESILNTVESLALILPLLFLVFRSAWLVAVGSLPSALSLVVVLGALGFSGATLSAAATGAAAMIFGLGVDGVVLLYVAHRLAVADDPAADVPAATGGTIRQHAARHVDHRGDLLRTDVRRLPEPAAARPADRAQHVRLRHPHARHGACAPAASLDRRPRPRPASDAEARAVDRASPPPDPGGERRADVRVGLLCHAHPHQSHARAAAVGHRCGAARNEDRSGVRSAERCLRRDRRGSAARTAASDQRTARASVWRRGARSRVSAADTAAAVGGRSGA